MANPKGNIFMTCLATGPPLTATLAYFLRPTLLTSLSLAAKTFFLLIYTLVVWKAVIPYFTSPFRHLPVPKNPRFFLGHGAIMLDRPPGTTPARWVKEVPNDGLVTFPGFFHLGWLLLLTKPDTVMEVLNAHSYDWEKPAPARKFLARVLGHGLINVEGNEHKHQRKNVTPAFSGKVIKDLIPLFWSKAFSFVKAIEREAAANANTIEISALASRVTLDIIGSAGIGMDFSTTEDAEHELAVQYSLITDPKKGNLPLYFAINMIFPQWVIRRLPLEANKRVANATFALRRITKELLEEKKQDMEEKTTNQKDIIATLMRSGQFSNDGLTDQLLTFLAAGHETTASALTWTTYLLSKHPEVQDRLRKECQATCQNIGPDGEITADIIDQMQFLDAVCNETLRVYPTVPVTSRVAIRDTQIGDLVIPKGSEAVIPIWGLNLSPALWGPDAEEYRPDRWLGEEGKHGGAASPYAFTTFLHGPRSCIGRTFARYELKCLLTVILLRFKFSLKNPNEVPIPEGSITIRPRDGLDLIVTPV